MGRSRTVYVRAAVVVGLLLGGACHYEASDDDSAAGSTAGIVTTTPDPVRVVADGTVTVVCEAADGVDPGGGPARVLADESFDREALRWVFCGDADGTVTSLRSVADGEWEARALPISGADTVEVTVADAGRAWITHDGLDTATHEHLWTTDGGTSWSRILAGA